MAAEGKNFDFSWSPHLVGTLNSMAFLLLLSFVLAYSTKANLSRFTCVSNYGERKGNKYSFEISTLLKRSRNIRVRMYAVIFIGRLHFSTEKYTKSGLQTANFIAYV